MVIGDLKTVVPSNGAYDKSLAERFSITVSITVKVESNGIVAWYKSSRNGMSAARLFDDWPESQFLPRKERKYLSGSITGDTTSNVSARRNKEKGAVTEFEILINRLELRCEASVGLFAEFLRQALDYLRQRISARAGRISYTLLIPNHWREATIHDYLRSIGKAGVDLKAIKLLRDIEVGAIYFSLLLKRDSEYYPTEVLFLIDEGSSPSWVIG